MQSSADGRQSHTILGTKAQRGLTQMTLDVLYRSIGSNIRRPCHPDLPTDVQLLQSLQASDASEALIIPATTFLENMYTDGDRARYSRAQTPMTGIGSRAQTPMTVCPQSSHIPGSFPKSPRPTLSPHATRSRKTAAARDSRASPRPSEAPHFLQLCRRGHGQFKTSAVNGKPLPTVPESFAEKDPWYPPSKTTIWERLTPRKKHAKQSFIQDSFPIHHARRPPMPRPSTFAHEPDMSSYATIIDSHCDYAVLVSMYEVYNDRIFDLLSSTSPGGPPMSTRQGAALQKGLMRRPLVFKNTEMSPDRKVVAGLKKILCSSYDEAMMILETGLTERRVAGTGSNSVSSRSHGFFCIEVKKKSRGNDYASHHMNLWAGGTLSIVDLAGSERARNAKTTGSTLAEAGKINESLMYLGQCLQVQSDCQQDGTKPIVPFRQCKLTELLFSNSFPSASNPSQYRPPQKAVMIVTADAQGDFNATSQILRYSALAREVTVPRVPSVTSVMGALKPGASGHSGRNTPLDGPQSYFSAQELEQAHHEISRLAEECNTLVVRLTEEEIKRTEAELKLQAAEEKALIAEQEVREECWQEMETMLEQEKQRWREAWDTERFNSQEYMDEKIEILEKNVSFEIHEDSNSNDRFDELERENEVLRAKLAAMEQEMQTRSPTKKARTTSKTPAKSPAKKASKVVLEETTSTTINQNPFLASLMEKEKVTLVLKPSQGMDDVDEDSRLSEISPRKLTLRESTMRTSVMTTSSNDEVMPVTPGTTKKKTRKLTTRKWDLGEDDF